MTPETDRPHTSTSPDNSPVSSKESASPKKRRRWKIAILLSAFVLILGGGLAVGAIQRDWWPEWQAAVDSLFMKDAEDHDHDHSAEHTHEGEHAHDDENDHQHDQAETSAEGHDDESLQEHVHQEADSLTLSDQARRNINLRLMTIRPKDFQRTVSIPAVLVHRPGRTKLSISAPMTGIVEQVHPIRGEAVVPGDPLFDLRLTHEDLVEKQSELLRALEELDVVKQEVSRLEKVTQSGAVAGKRLLEREYEQQKIEALIRAERQALLLHGLSESQIDQIIEDRKLLTSLTIHAPTPRDAQSTHAHDDFLQVSDIAVAPGEHVRTGTQLATLTDHCRLYIEGKAFEHDADALQTAANQEIPITAIIDDGSTEKKEVSGLKILYVENEIEMQSRALRFYLLLPNEMVRDQTTPQGRHFIGWRYKPGQRGQVLLPMEQWENSIVLPVDAVIQEGPEWYVYQKYGDHFDRQSVHLKHRDPQWAVLANDGAVSSGDQIVVQGAYQVHLALKNQSGSGIDPHAGHQH